MNHQRWRDETDPVRLLLKLHEEVGEVTHAFNRRHESEFLAEMDHVAFILARLRAEVTKSGIPDTIKTKGAPPWPGAGADENDYSPETP